MADKVTSKSQLHSTSETPVVNKGRYSSSTFKESIVREKQSHEMVTINKTVVGGDKPVSTPAPE